MRSRTGMGLLPRAKKKLKFPLTTLVNSAIVYNVNRRTSIYADSDEDDDGEQNRQQDNPSSEPQHGDVYVLLRVCSSGRRSYAVLLTEITEQSA